MINGSVSVDELSLWKFVASMIDDPIDTDEILKPMSCGCSSYNSEESLDIFNSLSFLRTASIIKIVDCR
jgi:hypothetical protein